MWACFIIMPASVFESASQLHRALVRAGATGARAPAEIWQRVQGTRPDKGAILVNSKKSTPKLKVNHLSKINSIE